MKKILVIAMCAALTAGIAGCGNNETAEEAEPIEEAETEVAEEVEAETEDLNAEEDGTEETVDEAVETDAEYVTGTYNGMTFELPGDWYYQGDDSTMSFMSPDNEAMILLQSVDLSDSDDEYSDEAIDLLFEASFEAIQAEYSDFQEESTTDLTFAGCEAKEMTATVTFSDTQMSDDALVIYDEEGRYFYMIQYVVKNEVEENATTYEHFRDTISFDA